MSRAGPNVYLHGYWQMDRYFAGIADVLRKALTLRHPPDARNAAYLERLASRISVSMHVRRGDYVSNPKAVRVHGARSTTTSGLQGELRSEAVKTLSFISSPTILNGPRSVGLCVKPHSGTSQTSRSRDYAKGFRSYAVAPRGNVILAPTGG